MLQWHALYLGSSCGQFSFSYWRISFLRGLDVVHLGSYLFVALAKQTSTRHVRSALSSLCPVSSNHHCLEKSAIWRMKILGTPRIEPGGSWLRRAIATPVLLGCYLYLSFSQVKCQLSTYLFYLILFQPLVRCWWPWCSDLRSSTSQWECTRQVQFYSIAS